MPLTLLFADGEVASVTQTKDGTAIRFSAAFVQRTDEASGKLQDGFARKVSLLLRGAHTETDTREWLGRISSGRVEIDGVWNSAIPLPSAFSGPVTLDFSFSNQSALLLEAVALECRFDEGENFAESLFC